MHLQLTGLSWYFPIALNNLGDFGRRVRVSLIQSGWEKRSFVLRRVSVRGAYFDYSTLRALNPVGIYSEGKTPCSALDTVTIVQIDTSS